MSGGATLHLAGCYRRSVGASLTRIWENVFDWEHLAHLHADSFSDCALLASGPWGWRVALTPAGGEPQEIELRADRANGRYMAVTFGGAGAGTEIHTTLAQQAPDRVDVAVEFHLPETDPGRLSALGEAYAAVYAKLWDEDEAMIQARARALARKRAPGPLAPPLDLGDEQTVRAALPIAFEHGGAPFRLVDLDGELAAHSTVCPHWLGPLDAAPVIAGEVRCPWHGYRFDVASGLCATHPGLRLAPAPKIRVDGARVIAAWC